MKYLDYTIKKQRPYGGGGVVVLRKGSRNVVLKQFANLGQAKKWIDRRNGKDVIHFDRITLYPIKNAD